MTAVQIAAEQPSGIIHIGERSPLASLASERLHNLGLFRGEACDIYTPELNSAMNSFRLANSLPEADYCDPVTLRLLCGIETGGDELLLLARACEAILPDATELERYDFCRETLREAKTANTALYSRIESLTDIGELLAAPPPSAETVKSAQLAFLLEDR